MAASTSRALTQRIINALTAPTRYGHLYQVDMRLRPSGRSGPLATQIDGVCQLSGDRSLDLGAPGADARARRRGVAGSSPLVSRPRSAASCAGRATPPRWRRDVVEMRQAIATEKGDSDRWNLKYVAGGLIDIEFIAQYLQLVHAAEMPDILDTSTVRVLDKAWRLGVLSDRGRGSAAAGGAALSGPDTDPAGLLSAASSIRRRRRPA